MKIFQKLLARWKKPPEDALACNHRGRELLRSGQFDQALASFDRAIALQPDFAQALNNRGNVLFEMERFEEALASFDRAIALKADFAQAFYNRGLVLRQQQRLEEAVASFDRAIALNPGFARAFNSRANTLRRMNRFEEALASFNAAIALKPDFAGALKNRGMLLLLLGRYTQGWADYEWRWQEIETGKRPRRATTAWQGENLQGRRLLVFREQGLGDSLQFVRYLPLLAQRGADVTCLMPPKLLRLLHPLEQGIRFTASVDQDEAFDFHCAMMSLPHRFGTELTSVPADIPYLFAEEALVSHWKNRLGSHGFKVGINWQGDLGKNTIPGRSIALDSFLPLAEIPGVRLISLQKMSGSPPGMPADLKLETLGDFDDGPDAFVDTAAVMANLDLIITCDTSVAHLAGALGRPTWVALKSNADWRWLLERSDSPWYPTLRLFRQPRAGDWDAVVREMAGELAVLANG
jgi:Tfp pilus assembly protein PilF